MRNPLLRSLAVQVKGLSLCLFAILVLATGVLAQTQCRHSISAGCDPCARLHRSTRQVRCA